MRRRGNVRLCREALEALDRELAHVARGAGGLRYSLGLALETLSRKGGHHDLAFSSFEAYALERCERGARWARESRALARRLAPLPLTGKALISGEISWSMALELVRVATPDTEASWLQRAAGCTVSQVKQIVEVEAGRAEHDVPPEFCTLTVTANVEDVWLFECVRILVQQMDGGTTDGVVDALVHEATTSLFAHLPKDAPDPLELVPDNEQQLAHNRQLAAWQEEGERICEAWIPRWTSDGVPANDAVRTEFAGSPAAIDAAIRRISAILEERETRLGELAERFWRANGWRILGYASEGQYARERLGMSIASVNDKRRLVRHLSERPHLARALREQAIGYEAARIVARVSTPETDAAWTAHAVVRTLVNLREDVVLAEHLARAQQRATVEPPDEKTVLEWRAVRSSVVTGTVFTEPPSRQKSGEFDAVRLAFASARNPPHLGAAGRDTLRLRVTPEIRGAFRGLERLFDRYKGPARMSFLRFACIAFIEQWAHERPLYAYAHIYLRDGLRCTNPTCCRRDVTPHHNRYRSHGGGDEPENLTSLCVWCHLRGVHQGRLQVRGRAPLLDWELGGHTTVTGHTRRRVA